ncbi:RING/U-box superfamily protein [Perilla frutescens var. hirtella]|uniref:RING/U-box superfamily protein n=1 Tax=Perilla frutescens var. hirtella TaxID=608512 RepID=A0AAD4J7X7_PERFH|nr:RING/U-box superfamily protein [Perilla frutescens var. hirtella]
MGSGISRTGSASYSRTRPQQPTLRRSISSVLICGSASSSSEMEDYPAELLVNSAEHGRRKKLKFPRRNSDLPVRNGDDLISIKSESAVSSRRFLDAYENTTLEVDASHDEPSDRGKWLSESRELVPSRQCIDSSRCNGTASSSYAGQPSGFLMSEMETSSMDGINSVNCNMKGDTSQIGQGFNNSSSVCNALGEPLLDEVSVENNLSEEIDYSSSDFGSPFVSDSPLTLDFHLLRDDVQEVTPPGLGFLVSEREQNRQDESLLHVDVADSRTFVFSPLGSDRFRSPDRQLLDFSSSFIDDEFVDLTSRGSRTPGSNDQLLNSRSEIWERLRGTLDSTDYPPPACPRGVHADGSCLCQSISSAEESGPRTGISRIVMLAEALFEVLDQIHQQPMSLSLSVVSLPAPESVVDSFPVKTHGKSKKLESADDVSQCYICLAEYEEGDKIRVLPCHHEYHMSCVDKWLKEIHGVCPLCRGDVCMGSTES